MKLNDYQELVRTVMLPFQWEALNDRVEGAEPSHAIQNFKIASGDEQGEFCGTMWLDSDLAKWLEAVGLSLQSHWDDALNAAAQSAIDLIIRAQGPDGYVNTYFQLNEPENRWTNVEQCHELYCAGHLMEAAVAYHCATGERAFLNAMCRYADHIDTVFGPEDGKLHGYPGHAEIELALVKLYRATKNGKYLNLAQYFVNQRGQSPNFFLEQREARGYTTRWPGDFMPLEYFQAHKPVREQDTATGHAVRALYLYSAMADLAYETGDKSLADACDRLWADVTERQMYITGAVGSCAVGESFSFDYDLPNDRMYAEACAAVGLVFFARRMLALRVDSHYADVIDRVLYNTVLGSMGIDGKSFFYVNPIEADPQACGKQLGQGGNPVLSHVSILRRRWYGCACCPPNIARLLVSLTDYIWMVEASNLSIWLNLFVPGNYSLAVGSGQLDIRIETDYPWEGRIRLEIATDIGHASVGIRIPDWAGLPDAQMLTAKPGGSTISTRNGYLTCEHTWKERDEMEIVLPMDIRLVRANPKVRADAGKVAIQRGPLIYCLEEADNGKNLHAISLDSACASTLSTNYDPDFLGGAVLISGHAMRDDEADWGTALYAAKAPQCVQVAIRAIPYFLWANRGVGEMLVWIRAMGV